MTVIASPHREMHMILSDGLLSISAAVDRKCRTPVDEGKRRGILREPALKDPQVSDFISDNCGTRSSSHS
jgi:hypothetical protein